MNPVVMIARQGAEIAYHRYGGGRETTDEVSSVEPLAAEDVELLRTDPELLLGPKVLPGDDVLALAGARLDLAVARALASATTAGQAVFGDAFVSDDMCFLAPGEMVFAPSSSHACGGKLADEHDVELVRGPAGTGWLARTRGGAEATGDTRLMASMRAIVRHHVGDRIDLA